MAPKITCIYIKSWQHAAVSSVAFRVPPPFISYKAAHLNLSRGLLEPGHPVLFTEDTERILVTSNMGPSKVC